AGDATLRAQAAQLAAKWRDLPSGIRGPVIAVAAADPKIGAKLAAALAGETDRNRRYDLEDALAGVRDPKRVTAALALALDPNLEGKEKLRLLAAVRTEPADVDAAQAFLTDHLDEIVASVPEQGRARLADPAGRACDPATRDAIAKHLGDAFTGA